MLNYVDQHCVDANWLKRYPFGSSEIPLAQAGWSQSLSLIATCPSVGSAGAASDPIRAHADLLYWGVGCASLLSVGLLCKYRLARLHLVGLACKCRLASLHLAGLACKCRLASLQVVGLACKACKWRPLFFRCLCKWLSLFFVFLQVAPPLVLPRLGVFFRGGG